MPSSGWPKRAGTEEDKQKDALRDIDSLLRHPDVQATFGRDIWGNKVIKYRAQEAHQEGLSGVTNTGRGVMYTKDGLAHLISSKGDCIAGVTALSQDFLIELVNAIDGKHPVTQDQFRKAVHAAKLELKASPP